MALLYRLWSRYAAVLLLAGVALAAAGVFHIPVREDEAWIGEQAYRLKQDGYVHSVLWQGYYAHEKLIVVYHYLFVHLTSWLLHVLPWSIESLRTIPFFSALALLCLVLLFVRKELNWQWKQALPAGALLVLFPISYEYMSYYRPEFLVAAFGFGSCWCLCRRRSSTWFALLAGLLAGLAMLCHLNGLIFACAGGLVLLLSRDWKAFLLFCMGVLLGFLPYLLQVFAQPDLYRYQLQSGANSGTRSLQWHSPFLNLLNEHKRLFRGPHTIFTSALLLVSIGYLYTSRATGTVRFLLVYTLLLMLFLGLLASSKTSQYSILFYPQAAILIALAVQQIMLQGKQLQPLFRGFFTLCWSLFTAFAIGWLFYPFVVPQPDLQEASLHLTQDLPDGSRCLTPMHFVFGEPDRVELLAMPALYELEGEITVPGLVAYCRKMQIGYLMLNPMWQQKIKGWQQHQDLFRQYFQEEETREAITRYRFRSGHGAG